MDVHLAAGLMDGLERRAGQFELPARLQAQRGAVLGPRSHKADDVVAFANRLPAEALHAFQQLADSWLAVIGQRLVGLEVVDEFLVLGADAPLVAGTAAFRQVTHKVIAALDPAAGGLRNGHEAPSRRYLRTVRSPRKAIIFVLT